MNGNGDLQAVLWNLYSRAYLAKALNTDLERSINTYRILRSITLSRLGNIGLPLVVSASPLIIRHQLVIG